MRAIKPSQIAVFLGLLTVILALGVSQKRCMAPVSYTHLTLPTTPYV